MRILLAHNSLYYPSHGGGDKSNRLLMEALAARGHEVRVVARIERFGQDGHRRYVEALKSRGVQPQPPSDGAVRFTLSGVDVRILTADPHWRSFFAAQIHGFDPDVIIASTDDPAQLLLDLALITPRARIVYLARATIAVPFGPDSSSPNEARADLLRRCDAVVGVSEYVAGYMRQWGGGVDAVHAPISLLDPGEPPHLGSFENEFVTIVNPCAVKGTSIFLALADAMPAVRFAAVPTWGTNAADLAALRARPNVTVLDAVDQIDELMRRTRVLLVPSLWAEARSRIVVEAMARGVPVMASDIGGIPEAKLGIPYLLPVNPIVRYKPAVDENMAPAPEVPTQDVAPWRATLARLLGDREHWETLSRASRLAALDYARKLSVDPFERLLEQTLRRPKRAAADPPARPVLSSDKQKLLALRLRQRAWLPNIESGSGQPRLFCFPYAGAGALAYRGWVDALRPIAAVCPVRLPGRESRLAEAPLVTMDALIAAIEPVLLPFLDAPYAFYGHSMGAAIAFELARALRRSRRRMPVALYVSGARAPQFRLNWSPPPEPADDELIEQLQRAGGASEDNIRLALPSLRADTALYRQYMYRPEPALALPIFAYAGRADPNVAVEQMSAWREQTTAAFSLREFEGGHFFVQSSGAAFLAALLRDITGQMSSTSSPRQA